MLLGCLIIRLVIGLNDFYITSGWVSRVLFQTKAWMEAGNICILKDKVANRNLTLEHCGEQQFDQCLKLEAAPYIA